jgi:D-glycero-D-manno-heptose 1,7-bisphosphate phosphatase
MARALFLDRDGVLDELVYYQSSGEWESPRTASDVRMVPGAAEALRKANQAGWLLVIITNQPSFAKGKTSRQDLLDAHDLVLGQLGVPIAKSALCFHHPDAVVDELRVTCECRKPAAGSILAAARELDIDLAQSWMAGDQDSDLASGRAAGVRVALIETPESADKRGGIEPDLRCRDLAEFVSRVVNSEP